MLRDGWKRSQGKGDFLHQHKKKYPTQLHSTRREPKGTAELPQLLSPALAPTAGWARHPEPNKPQETAARNICFGSSFSLLPSFMSRLITIVNFQSGMKLGG